MPLSQWISKYWGALVMALLCACPLASTEFRPSDFVEADLRGAQEISGLVRGGSARIELPWPWIADGKRYTMAQIGPGWVRLLEHGAPRGGGLQAEASIPGATEQPSPSNGLLLEVLGGQVSADATSRVLLANDGRQLVIRWIHLRVGERRSAATVEVILRRFGGVRFQYLDARGLQALETDPPRAGIVQPGRRARLPLGRAIRNASSFEWGPDLGGIDLSPPTMQEADGPPPDGCVAPIEDWCATSDGPTGDAIIYLDTRFEDFPNDRWMDWTSSAGNWHRIDFDTCSPGAIDDPGFSVYVGDDQSCTYGPNIADELATPPFGPVTANSWFRWSSRFGFANPGTDSGSIQVRTVGGGITWTLGSMPDGLDPSVWWNFNPIQIPNLFDGQMVEVVFLFESGPLGGNPNSPGWMVDNFIAWDENGANWECVRNAQYFQNDPRVAECSETEDQNWIFDESAFCLGCDYTFYALVECGREMHLPLWDMEGAEVSVTEVVTGSTPILTCRNEAAIDPDARVYEGTLCNCAEGWIGQPWSATDSAGPGSVAWGFGDQPIECAVGTNAYTPTGQPFSCNQLPACGSSMDRISVGDEQVMDCFIEPNAGEAGLCGIYRIDVRSGGFAWQLFANCQGDDTPEFRLFHNCEDAWAAFNPLPELAISDPQDIGECPDTEIQFTIDNLGCTEYMGEVVVTAVNDCPVPDTDTWPIAVDIPANQSTMVSRPFTSSCEPAVVTLTIDPGGLIDECSESPDAAACNVIPGADSVVVDTCDCAASLTISAGEDAAICGSQDFLLVGELLDDTGCGDTPQYRWLASDGREIRGWSEDPTFLYSVPCPFDDDLIMESQCDQGLCQVSDTMRVTCFSEPERPTPTAEPVCDGERARLECGSSEPGVAFRWDFDITVDEDGDTDPANDFEGFDCISNHTYPGPGTYTAQVMALNANQCTSLATLEIEVVPSTPPDGEIVLRMNRPDPSVLRTSWQAHPDATTYRIARGTLGGTWYDHDVDESVTRGICDTGGEVFFEDSDDLTTPGSFYYLGVPVTQCGVRGIWGTSTGGTDRGEILTPSACP